MLRLMWRAMETGLVKDVIHDLTTAPLLDPTKHTK